MNASKVDQALTRPVALRRNRVGRAPALPIVVSAMFSSPSLRLTVDELVALDSLLGVEVDDRRHEDPLLIGAAWIDGKRFAELHRALALVNVSMQREQWLVLIDRLAH